MKILNIHILSKKSLKNIETSAFELGLWKGLNKNKDKIVMAWEEGYNKGKADGKAEGIALSKEASAKAIKNKQRE